MDTFWEEAVIMTCKWNNVFALRTLNKTCLSICDQNFNIYDIRFLKKVVKAWRLATSRTLRRPYVNSLCRKIVHPDERYIILF